MQALDVISVATTELGDGQHAHVEGIVEAEENPIVVRVQLWKVKEGNGSCGGHVHNIALEH